MGIPIYPSPSVSNTALPTPAQSPATLPLVGLPTPIADSVADIFNTDVPTGDGDVPPYTSAELENALDNPPVHATVWYGTHLIRGTFYYNPALFMHLYERFMDISPSDEVKLDSQGCKPWTLLNQAQGQTWIDETVLSEAATNTIQLRGKQPRFVAVTDSLEVLHHAISPANPAALIANIDWHGKLHVGPSMKTSNDIIVALPSGAPLDGSRQVQANCPSKQFVRSTAVVARGQYGILLKDLTPAPTSSAVLSAVRKIHGAADQDRNMNTSTPKKAWLTKHLSEHFIASDSNAVTAPTPQKPRTLVRGATLSPSSPLWAHRGNEALLKRQIWQQLCYHSAQNDGNIEARGGVRVPDAYWQVLFEDLQGRERVAGSEELAWGDPMWYLDGTIMGMEEGDGVAAVGKVERTDSGYGSQIVGGNGTVQEVKIKVEDDGDEDGYGGEMMDLS